VANDNRLFLRDFGVLGEGMLFLFGVVFGCFRLVVFRFLERVGVFADFLLDFRREGTQSNRQRETK
jgi:hypothetical protein